MKQDDAMEQNNAVKKYFTFPSSVPPARYVYDRNCPSSFERFTVISCLIARVPYRVLFNMVSFIISLLCRQRSEPMKSTRVLLSLLF